MEEKNNLTILCAPIQGLTELPWRHYHREIFGDGVTGYFTPFLRVERGEVRYRDVRDLKSELNGNLPLIPQIIVRDMREFEMLCDKVREAGYDRADINMGCPFPPQVHHGRGAGMIANVELLRSLASVMAGKYGGDMKFSVKMRLGVSDPTEWQGAIDAINEMPLTHVTVHPRTASQQYGGDLCLDDFEKLLARSAHPVMFNGDITESAHIDAILDRFPGIAGVMIGRGMFSRPSIVAEWRSGEVWDEKRRLSAVKRLHAYVYGYYRDTLSGDAQVLGKIRSFWEYMATQIDRKAYKGIKKASSLRKYDDAVGMI